MAEKKNKSFEEIIKKLEETSEKLKGDEVPLEDAIRSYEEGIGYYRECCEILEKAGQKIETLSKKGGA